MRVSRLVIVIIAGVTIAAACEKPAGTELSSAAAHAPLSSTVGPQPGVDRGLTEPKNPYANDKDVLAEGRRLFNWYNCSGCHGDHAGGAMGPSLRDSSWRYGSRDDQIFESIAEGRQFGMPEWGTKLNRDQIWKIVTYIKSLRTPNEPDAPSPKR